jgi:hypothetical protein
LQVKLKDSELKRQDTLKKNMTLQKRVLELEVDVNKAKDKIRDIISRKASVILKEQLQIMELA